MMKKILRWSGFAIGIVLVIIQCIRPDRSAPAFDQSLGFARLPGADTSVTSILRRSCYDCHSFETQWPWYSAIAPASWLVANDVQGGRRHLNFSIWAKYADSRKIQSLEDIHDEISDGGMPLPQYLFLHPGARLSQAERETLLRWTERERTRLGGE
jgi:Haem-binding domain